MPRLLPTLRLLTALLLLLFALLLLSGTFVRLEFSAGPISAVLGRVGMAIWWEKDLGWNAAATPWAVLLDGLSGGIQGGSVGEFMVRQCPMDFSSAAYGGAGDCGEDQEEGAGVSGGGGEGRELMKY